MTPEILHPNTVLLLVSQLSAEEAKEPAPDEIQRRGGLHYHLYLDESQRQLVIMALAHLAVERPGFETALAAIVEPIDNPGPEMFGRFKTLHVKDLKRR